MLLNKQQKQKIVSNTPTLGDALEQLKYFKEVYKACASNDALANLNRAYMVYQTKLIEQEKK